MTFKYDEHFKRLADKAGVKPYEFAERVYNAFDTLDTFFDDTECFGCTILSNLENCYLVTDVISVIKDAGIKDVTCEDLSDFLMLVVMGDGDCPECGGEGDCTDFCEKGKSTFGDAPCYNPSWEQYTCPVCGHVYYKEF